MTNPASEVHRALIIANGEDARAALRRAVERAGIASAIDEAVDADRALARAATEPWECVLIDHRPVETGIELIRAIRERSATVPILLVAERLDEELELAAVGAGATDLVTREDLSPTRLARRMRAAARVGQDARMLSEATAAAAARDDLLAVVSHDLRSPLNAIVLACDALDGAAGEPASAKRYVAAIRRASNRAERLLRDLLDVSRIESGGLRLERRAVPVRSLLDQARGDHEMLARDAGTEITVAIEDDPGAVLVDRDRMRQVLANLIGNALKHAPGTAIRLEARAEAGQVAIAVVDHGPGIAAEALPHVFDRFWQGRARRRGGAGLGLAIARGLVEAHDGTIEVASELGQGTRFTIRMPQASR